MKFEECVKDLILLERKMGVVCKDDTPAQGHGLCLSLQPCEERMACCETRQVDTSKGLDLSVGERFLCAFWNHGLIPA